MEPTGRTRTSPHRLWAPADLARLDTDLARLDAIRARPALIERAVRTALIDAMKWRLGGGGAPAENSFAYAAAAAARQDALACGFAAQRTDVANLARAAAAAAVRFFRAPLGKRLLALPLTQIVASAAPAGGADVAIRDRAGRLHLIALTTLVRPLDISARAREVAGKSTLAPRDRLSAVRIHMFSLVTGRRHESSGWLARSDDAPHAARIA